MKDIIREILKEETDMLDKSILNFLRRRGESKVQKFGDDFEVQTVSFFIPYRNQELENPNQDTENVDYRLKGEWYSVTSFMSKKDMTYKIFNMLEESETISLGEYNPRVLNTDRQKVIKTIRYYIDNIFKKQ